MPTEDKTALSPEPTFTDIGFPSGIPVMATTKTFGGLQSQLNLATSQYFTDDTPGRVGATVMRRWTGIGGRVFYNASTSYAKPTILTSAATRFGSNVGFNVSVCGVVRVFVLFDDLGVPGVTKNWTGINLVRDTSPGSCRWTGGAPIVGPNVQYIVQACNADGNCAMSTNKAHYYQAQPQPPAPTGDITITLSGTAVPGVAGYFSGPVSVNATPAAGSEIRLDGQLRASVPFSVTADGLHVVSVDTASGHGEKAFVIDATAPQVILTTPAADATYAIGQVVKADFRCLDSGSGVTSCTGTKAVGAAIDTSTVGDKTFTVTARDAAGHTTTVTRTYHVTWPFTGFLFPVKNPPVFNVVHAGFYIPLRFSLDGNRGLQIFASGYPKSAQIPCPTPMATNDDDEGDSLPLPSVLGLRPADRPVHLLLEDRAPVGRDVPPVRHEAGRRHAPFGAVQAPLRRLRGTRAAVPAGGPAPADDLPTLRQAALAELQLLVRLLDHERVVRRAEDRGAGLARQPAEQRGHRDGIRAVEAGRRLVGEQEPRPRRDRAGDGDALALAGREPRDALLRALGEPDGLERLERAPGAEAADRERQLHVLACGEERDEAGLLPDEADEPPAELCAPGAVERGERRAVEHDVSRVRQLEPGEDVQERRLAGPGRAR